MNYSVKLCILKFGFVGVSVQTILIFTNGVRQIMIAIIVPHAGGTQRDYAAIKKRLEPCFNVFVLR